MKNKKLARFEAKFNEVAAPLLAKYADYRPPWTCVADLVLRMEGSQLLTDKCEIPMYSFALMGAENS